MRQTNNPITGISLRKEVISCAQKMALLALMVWGLSGELKAQSHDSEDTLIALPADAFSLTLVQNLNNQFTFEIKNNGVDTITPFFVELFPVGFDFTDQCILQQKINNINLDANIEKLWGPQFVSLGVGNLPPSGSYATTIGTETNLPNTYVKVRLFGTVNDHNIIWVGYLKK